MIASTNGTILPIRKPQWYELMKKLAAKLSKDMIYEDSKVSGALTFFLQLIIYENPSKNSDTGLRLLGLCYKQITITK